jgi:hypothetical protein
MATFTDLASAIFRGISHSQQGKPKPDAGVPVVKIRDIHGASIAPVSDLGRVVATGRAAQRTLAEGDIVVAALGRSRKHAVVGAAHAGCLPDAHLLVVRPLDASAREQLLAFLNSDAGSESIANAMTGAVIPHLSGSTLATVEVS